MTTTPTPGASGLPPVRVYNAGSLNAVLDQDVIPAFQQETGYAVVREGGPAVGLANQIRSGEISPDVYLSADAEVNWHLMGPANGNRLDWFVTVARTRMVLAYSPVGKFAADFAAAAAGQLDWLALLQRPGLVLKRGDPRDDPGGYRAVFVFQLAERLTGEAGLAQRLLGGEHNEQQVMVGGMNRLKDGTVDAIVAYTTGATQVGVPALQLPDDVDLGNPAKHAFYDAASYTNPHGQTFRGAPAFYSAAIPRDAANREGAEVFIRYLLTEGQRALAGRGFLPAEARVGGREDAVPVGLRPLIAGRYGVATAS